MKRIRRKPISEKSIPLPLYKIGDIVIFRHPLLYGNPIMMGEIIGGVFNECENMWWYEVKVRNTFSRKLEGVIVKQSEIIREI